ncbi:MAG: hypothetical protein UY04_C0051G0003 [Parcubacteria group bacterium GW2011_GWA2_47_7]|nr:MAG: hypothetical protein UY04_C0051G0003 [Parcubacteria group bacterium GW2011_GWA2_47_7]
MQADFTKKIDESLLGVVSTIMRASIDGIEQIPLKRAADFLSKNPNLFASTLCYDRKPGANKTRAEINAKYLDMTGITYKEATSRPTDVLRVLIKIDLEVEALTGSCLAKTDSGELVPCATQVFAFTTASHAAHDRPEELEKHVTLIILDYFEARGFEVGTRDEKYREMVSKEMNLLARLYRPSQGATNDQVLPIMERCWVEAIRTIRQREHRERTRISGLLRGLGSDLGRRHLRPLRGRLLRAALKHPGISNDDLAGIAVPIIQKKRSGIGSQWRELQAQIGKQEEEEAKSGVEHDAGKAGTPKPKRKPLTREERIAQYQRSQERAETARKRSDRMAHEDAIEAFDKPLLVTVRNIDHAWSALAEDDPELVEIMKTHAELFQDKLVIRISNSGHRAKFILKQALEMGFTERVGWAAVPALCEAILTLRGDRGLVMTVFAKKIRPKFREAIISFLESNKLITTGHWANHEGVFLPYTSRLQ